MSKGLKTRIRHVAHSIFGCLILATLTYACYRFHLNFATTGFASLILIVLLSFAGSLISGTILAIAAVACLDYFFTPPLFSFRISDPLNILALATFLVTTLAITYLMTRVRHEKQSSERQRKEMQRLYELAQELLELTPEELDLSRLLALFRNAFALHAICLIEIETSSSHISGTSRYDLEAWTRVGHTAKKDLDDFERNISVRNLRVAGQVTGILGMEGLTNQELTADALAALATSTLERTRAFRASAHAAAVIQAEKLRSILLDALAHAVKTPLATILTAAGGLRATGDLNFDHLEFVDVVESEAASLGMLTTRLLRMANLDRDNLHLQLQHVDLSNLIAQELTLKSQQFSDHKLSLLHERGRDEEHVEVEADPELLRLALAQLIENACKYSEPGSKVEVGSYVTKDSVAIRVWNCSHIPEEEQPKIFDRFYRGKQLSDSTLGTGLGLDIARRIAVAHGGTLALEESTAAGSVFRLTIPVTMRTF